MTECYFTPKKDITSATICVNCGLEKMLHTIGEGIKVKEIIIITKFKNPNPATPNKAKVKYCFLTTR